MVERKLAPLVATTLCLELPTQRQLTVEPLLMVTERGEKKSSPTRTDLVAAPTPAGKMASAVRAQTSVASRSCEQPFVGVT